MAFSLYTDQIDFEDGIRSAYQAGRQSVLGVAPTGFGKTVVFSDIAARVEANGKSVGIFAHRAELIDQIGRALNGFGVRHGYLAPGFSPDPLASVQVCSIQAAARRVERFLARPFDQVILDEAHHAAEGSSAHAIINAHLRWHTLGPNRTKKRILGVTATPIRLSGEPLSISFEDMVLGPSTADLITGGRLTRFRLFNPSRPDMSGVAKRGGDFARDQTAGVMDRPSVTGDAVKNYADKTPNARAVVFCVSVEHAEHVAQQFREAGFSAMSLDGKMDRNLRRQIIRDFTNGTIKVLTSCDIVSEGFDLPAIEVAILLRPTESLALYLQQVGRALRLFPGKEYAWIFDHAGNSIDKRHGGRGHGFPDDPREWFLGGADEYKKRSGERTTPTCICGQCFAVFRPAPQCPWCGHSRDINGREVRYVEGELEEVDPNLVREARRQEQNARNARIASTWTLAGLADLAVEFGYKATWLHERWRARKKNPAWPFKEAVRALKAAEARARSGRAAQG